MAAVTRKGEEKTTTYVVCGMTMTSPSLIVEKAVAFLLKYCSNSDCSLSIMHIAFWQGSKQATLMLANNITFEFGALAS